MRMLLALPVFLLLASPAAALLTNYSWTGSIDWGETREQTLMSGSMQTDGRRVNKLTLDIGSYRYVWFPQFYEAAGLSPLSLHDAPLVTEDLAGGGDLQFFEGSRIWAFQWKTDDDLMMETGGSVSSFFRGGDSNPTPEPSSFVLFGSALLGLGFYRYRRRRLKFL